MAVIGNKSRSPTDPFCAGTIVSLKLILTLAECVKDFACDKSELKVHVDALDGVGRPYLVSYIYIHPNFTSANRTTNNVALIELRNKIINYFAEPPITIDVCVKGAVAREGLYTSAVGWEFGRKVELRKRIVTIVSKERCFERFSNREFKSDEICALESSRWTNYCSSSLGAALVVDKPRRQLGILSDIGGSVDGKERCDAGSRFTPAVYVSVEPYQKWICRVVDKVGRKKAGTFFYPMILISTVFVLTIMCLCILFHRKR